ncbi:hypothetical protein BLOT_006392 [Blomia tropicalis]|nr:hypothetical protein BLOT_006392 [Blomia tropicalis]
MENPSINSDNDRSEQSSSRNERHDHRGNGGNGRYRDTNVGYRGGRGRGFHENGNSRNRGSGSRSRGFHHHQQRSRGIAQHRGPPQPASFQQSKTLVIKDSDNEFLRMLTQANNDSNEKILSQLESNPSSSGVHLSKRILTSIQPSRQSRPADPNHKACPVCLMDSPSLTGELVQAITSCEHVYCFECALRLIFITNKSDCPICRQALSKVTLTRAESLDDVPELKSFLSSTQQSHKQYKKFSKMVFFDAAEGEGIFDLIKQILWFNCTFCKKVPYSFHMDTKNAESYDAISKHLIKHDRNLCDLCFFNLELFPYEYELYTNYEMDQHKSLGSVVGEAQVHHRICYLCPEPGFFFDNDALSAHCKEAHISCYVCTSQAIFFADQPSLLEHVVEKHIICPKSRI